MMYEYRPFEHHFTWLPSINNLHSISCGVLSISFEEVAKADTILKRHEFRKGIVLGKLLLQNWRLITEVISIYIKKNMRRQIATIKSMVVWTLGDLGTNCGHEAAGKWYYA